MNKTCLGLKVNMRWGWKDRAPYSGAASIQTIVFRWPDSRCPEDLLLPFPVRCSLRTTSESSTKTIKLSATDSISESQLLSPSERFSKGSVSQEWGGYYVTFSTSKQEMSQIYIYSRHYQVYLAFLYQRAEHMSQMQIHVVIWDLLKGFKFYHWSSKLWYTSFGLESPATLAI